ncbi:hypothetical protein KY338_03775 [Candidatus Woesearchaeota archaeon]|nr:hypothetical protein [Candidatus Woesearchaeota archaeon]MBW3005431.1 hypothetical protein [Candidatus Woesearchaeota archaeon]
MATYEFQSNGEETYQLFRKRWLGSKKLDVYFSKNHFGRYVLSVSYKDESADTNMMSSIQAKKIVRLLKNLGVSNTALRNTNFSKGADSRAKEHLCQLVASLEVAE